MKKSILAAALLLASVWCSAQETRPLYGPKGVTPDAVRQGSIGSCYFHSVLGAMASTDPDALKADISESRPGEYAVRFTDGSIEHVLATEAQSAIDNGYDDSDGLWVAVMFRAYAHRAMRKSLLDAVSGSQMVSLAKYGATMLVNSSDFVLLAYDRAVRSQIQPDGSIDKAALRAKLEEELKTTPLSADARARVLDVIDTQGFFDQLAADVKDNGEIFGAYRSPSQGGLPHRVFESLVGQAQDLKVDDGAEVVTTLQTATARHTPMMAATRGTNPVSSVPGASMWYVNSHAYTVLGFDSDKKTVTIRNPWGEHPAPDGKVAIPLETFRLAFDTMCLGVAGK